jgi:hypothetical protein
VTNFPELIYASGYESATICVEVVEHMAEEDFRVVEEVLGEPLGRYKDWATRYVFSPDTHVKLDRLTRHLRFRGLEHVIEVELTWRP